MFDNITQMDTYDFLNSSEPEVIENLYQTYLYRSQELAPDLRHFFAGFDFAAKNYKRQDGVEMPSEFKVLELIRDYRQRGHLFTKTNPVRTRRKYSPNLSIENYGLTSEDLDKVFKAGIEIGLGPSRLRDIIEHLDKTYCQSIGAEFMFIRQPEIVKWLLQKMEPVRNTPAYTHEQKKAMLTTLSRAVLFEKFIHKKFPGQKRFSLEGAESLIPALHALMEKGVEMGNQEFVIGMPHRGRLNVLANVLKKPFSSIFAEFRGLEYEDELLLGDVKYHLGYTSTLKTLTGKQFKVTLAPNPSHLEAVNPVVQGITRALLDAHYQRDNNKITPILIHGDASVAGQGIVYEVLQMSGLPAYSVGGTVHIVVNNQIGFTTHYLDGRTSIYCTDVAKTVQAPVFHVNADDVEAVVFAIQLAMEFRETFHRDVFIDLLGYRRYGHNESDEPRFTQPVLYKIIEKHPDPRSIYFPKLIAEGVVTREFVDAQEEAFSRRLEESLQMASQKEKINITNLLQEEWKDFRRAREEDFYQSPETGYKIEKLKDLTQKMTTLPEDKKFFRKLVKLLEERRDMVVNNEKVDWAMAELLAYASLVTEGYPVRMSGQDVERGTFSHRHAVLTIEDSEERYSPLAHLSPNQASFEIYNSLLSEYGVLGYEYGYALARPKALTIWEAQFGDFANGAQIIFDQFISSAEDKWNVMNGLTLFLPHGYEGQGPEHSSARIERVLILAAENNMQVVNCTTPANFFHVLRRQVLRDIRKPLIVFTPKSLLRHPSVISDLNELGQGRFLEVIDDPKADPAKVERLIFCWGKVYYDLLEEKEKTNAEHVAIVRIEQMYPFPKHQVESILEKYGNTKVRLWVQEEPANMGAWGFLKINYDHYDLKLIARPASGSPATGSSKFHFMQQRKIIDKAFHQCVCPRLDIECRMVCIGNKWQTFARELQDPSN
ncbi:MAG: 2-oxoglutarate dehydrogenase E1 component [Bacteroidota bacterium]